MTRTEYRGYVISLEGQGPSWNVAARPNTPFLPILGLGSFVITSPGGPDSAYAEIKKEIDRILDNYFGRA
jgi:hypothetical protein